jgi:type VI secretion system secreted protein VgrG
MGKYSQANRVIKVDSPLGSDVLLLESFTGHEEMSAPFAFTLNMASEKDNIKGQDLLRKALIITLHLPGDKERKIHGLVSRFLRLGVRDDLTLYQAEIVPWVWFLTLSGGCRVFQNMTALEIIEKVFKDAGYSDFQNKCVASYPKREYCVQYRESNYNFATRLMQEEGIYFYFDHTASKHTLVMADRSASAPACPEVSKARLAEKPSQWQKEDVIIAVRDEHNVASGKYTLWDHNFEKPSLRLQGQAEGDSDDEIYDYPANAMEVAECDRLARLRLEEREAMQLVVHGESTVRGLVSGHRFTLTQSVMDGDYLLVRVAHRADAGEYRPDETVMDSDYRNTFVCIPKDTPFRPPLDSRKAVVEGPQTAVVVGKSGEEIWVDKYGRVKIQFHWDREGKKDDTSSCWVRVASTWAGKQWGFIQIPRIGQEVVVDFLEGDPDQPIITGRVWNADNMPPYALPSNQTQSGIKTRSSPKGGSENFNEIRFEDKRGEELFVIHAEKDYERTVENDETIEIGHDRKETVKNNETVTIQQNEKRTVQNGNQTIKVASGKQSITVQSDQSLDVKMGKQTTTVDMGDVTTVAKMGKITTQAQMGNIDTKADLGNITIKAQLGKITLEALQGIELKVGPSSIKVDMMGVTIKGMNTSVEGQVMAKVQGVMTQVNGQGMLQARGGITMIN